MMENYSLPSGKVKLIIEEANILVVESYVLFPVIFEYWLVHLT